MKKHATKSQRDTVKVPDYGDNCMSYRQKGKITNATERKYMGKSELWIGHVKVTKMLKMI